MSEVAVRAAQPADAAAIAAIYAAAVVGSYATFDVEAPAPDEWRASIVGADAHRGHHVLVATVTGQVVGYAKSGTYRARPAYEPTVEISVYLAPGRTGRGLGRALYEVLIPQLERGPSHLAVAGIATPNEASVALHQRFGFRHVGTFHEMGFKLGGWRDVSWYQRPLDTPGQSTRTG